MLYSRHFIIVGPGVVSGGLVILHQRPPEPEQVQKQQRLILPIRDLGGDFL